MAARPVTLKLENLESRLNLSTASGLLAPIGATSLRNVVDSTIYNTRQRFTTMLGSDTMLGGNLAGRPNNNNISAPSNIKATCNSDSIALKWNDNSNNETGFNIYRSADNGLTYSIINTVAANSTSYSDTTAQSNIRYLYKVQAYNNTTTSAVSRSVAAMLTPSAPTGLQASVTSTSVSLSWTDTSTGESGYHLYRSTDGVNFNYSVNLPANTTSFKNTGVNPATTYYYKIAAWNNYGENSSSVIHITTSPVVVPTASSPTSPTALTFSNISNASVTLNWHDNSTNESGFHVYRSTDGSNYSLLGNVGVGATTYVDNSVTAGTTYYYEVSAWNSVGEAISSAASLTTPSAAPLNPSGLTFTNVTASSLTLNWQDNSNNETGFHVYRSADGISYSLIGALAANTTSFTDTTFTDGTTYIYKVTAWNSSAESWSGGATITTPSGGPLNPSGLTFTNVTASSLTLNWQDNSNNETGFHVYRSADGISYSLIGALAANTTSFTDTTFTDGTTYIYKVTAWNSSAESWSGGATITTPSGGPLNPSGLTFTNVTASSLTLNWQDNSNNETGFQVYRSTDGTNYSIVGNLAAGSTTFNDSGLSAGTTYYYEVDAVNATGQAASSVASATTSVVIPPPPTFPVTVASVNMTSFTELQITGTSGNDSIFVSQSNGVLTITADGATMTVNNTFGDLVIHGGQGNDSITVDSSVNIATLIYGGDGNDTISNKTSGKATIVTIGNGVNTLTGNGINTAFWANPNDIINATATEIANGGVNRVANWYQTSVGAVPRGLYGQNLADPTDSGGVHRDPNSSFWGTGPVMNDINQGTIGDCYFLAPLASMANNETVKFMNTGVDLGDGTYAVRFQRNGVTTYVRVDGDLPNSYYEHPGASGNIWGVIYEKAYAFFRTGASTYASLNWGNPSATFNDLGFAAASVSPTASDATLLSTINNAINSGHAVAGGTMASVTAVAPLIASHAYSIIGAYRNASGTLMIELRNPWGFDGAGNDGNPGDGLVTIDYATFSANFSMLNYTTT